MGEGFVLFSKQKPPIFIKHSEKQSEFRPPPPPSPPPVEVKSIAEQYLGSSVLKKGANWKALSSLETKTASALEKIRKGVKAREDSWSSKKKDRGVGIETESKEIEASASGVLTEVSSDDKLSSGGTFCRDMDLLRTDLTESATPSAGGSCLETGVLTLGKPVFGGDSAGCSEAETSSGVEYGPAGLDISRTTHPDLIAGVSSEPPASLPSPGGREVGGSVLYDLDKAMVLAHRESLVRSMVSDASSRLRSSKPTAREVQEDHLRQLSSMRAYIWLLMDRIGEMLLAEELSGVLDEGEMRDLHRARASGEATAMTLESLEKIAHFKEGQGGRTLLIAKLLESLTKSQSMVLGMERAAHRLDDGMEEKRLLIKITKRTPVEVIDV